MGARSTMQEKRHLTPGEIAWLLAVPCGLLTVAAMVFLGAPLGSLLLASRGKVTIVPEWQFAVFLKPAQEARYLIALVAPMLLSATTVICVRRRPRLMPRTAGALVTASQCAGVAFVVICVVAQNKQVFGSFPHSYTRYFTIPTLIVAGALTLAAVLTIRSATARRRLAAALSNRSRTVTSLALGAALLMTAIWILAGINLEDTLRNAAGATLDNLNGPLDETYAVLDGRTPLVNFIPLYAWLWPYLTALVMSVFGVTFTVFSITMCAIAFLSLLAIFSVLRRVTQSSLGALLLYLPFLATGLFYIEPPGVNRYGPVTLYTLFPLRYAGPYLLVWLVARHIDGVRPHRRWLLFMAGGVVVLNNTDFGIPAFGATLAALLWSGAPLGWAQAVRVLRDAVAGLVAAYGLVSILTLVRTGSFVHIGALFVFARLFGLTGLTDLSTPTLGLHIVIYLTYVAAIGVATVRAVGGERGRLLTGLLVWSGIYGLGLGGYYMGRTTPEAVEMMFSAWALALAFLAVVGIEAMVREPRRLTIAQCAVLFGMGVAACSLAETPPPWAQIKRLEARAAPIDVASPALTQFLANTGGGKPEAIMGGLAHRVAYEAGVVDASPFIGMGSIFTLQQFDEALCGLRAEGGRLLVLPIASTFTAFYRATREAGFTYLGSSELDLEAEAEVGQPGSFTMWWAPAVAQQPCGPTGAVTR